MTKKEFEEKMKSDNKFDKIKFINQFRSYPQRKSEPEDSFGLKEIYDLISTSEPNEIFGKLPARIKRAIRAYRVTPVFNPKTVIVDGIEYTEDTSS